ncbi:hypothetical protein [Marinifilum caeruleilacunae]|uniref:Lipoprotein n=1 Tax=Marinifilum caeruleilacunae TaxID=2499076 RepID=A0ABX1WU63_9BACT|nr:hypothetical protein [Marinifilum caeruleilacunae]NOU59653.1 hypothetical protein [Marinifilum caeruleilacunae]
MVLNEKLNNMIPKQLKFFSILSFLILILIGCSDDDPILELKDTRTGQLLFYTDIQAMANCGEFDVIIQINQDSVGVLHKPYLANTLPERSSSDTTLLLSLDVGKVNYKALFPCGNGGYWTNEVEVLPDSCIYIFLDVDDLKLNDK